MRPKPRPWREDGSLAATHPQPTVPASTWACTDSGRAEMLAAGL